MTKKDYVVIVRAIRRHSTLCGNEDCGNSQRFIDKEDFINTLWTKFKEDNKNFNKDIFIECCYD